MVSAARMPAHASSRAPITTTRRTRFMQCSSFHRTRVRRPMLALTMDRFDHAARDQRRDVEQDPRQRQPARGREIPRPPQRQEFLLVLAQALEVVEVVAVAVYEPADLVPCRREPMFLE